jgi:hypothetical protein
MDASRIASAFWILATLVAAAPGFAQGPNAESELEAQRLAFLMQIRADEYRDDSAGNRLVLRGNVEFSNGLRLTGEIVCDRNDGVWKTIDFVARTDDRSVVGVATCVAWTEALRRDGRLR